MLFCVCKHTHDRNEENDTTKSREYIKYKYQMYIPIPPHLYEVVTHLVNVCVCSLNSKNYRKQSKQTMKESKEKKKKRMGKGETEETHRIEEPKTRK